MSQGQGAGDPDRDPGQAASPQPRFRWRLALPEPEELAEPEGPAESEGPAKSEGPAESEGPTESEGPVELERQAEASTEDGRSSEAGGDPEGVRPEPGEFGGALDERRVGPYVLGETLGSGGQGAVYRARDTRVGRWVALKVLRDTRERAAARFRREAEATAALRHPGIVRVHDAGEIGATRYVAYELIEGARDLGDLLAEGQRPEAVARWVAEIAAALSVAHRQGVVHRDLKPANVLVDGEGRLRVADFGLARLEEGTRLTESLAAVGTPLYMSPEQIRGERELSAAVDVWALGVILYEGFTGERPFQATTMAELSVQIVSSEVRNPRGLAPGLTPALAAVCVRCLQRDPRARYAEGGALQRALEEALGAEPVVWGRVAAALSGLVAALLVALSLAWPARVAPLPEPADPARVAECVARGELEAGEALAAQLEPGPPRSAWQARIQSERGVFAEDLEARLAAEGVSTVAAGQVAALCSLRAALVRGERPLSAARAARARWPQSRALALAEAELLLCAGRVLEARDLLASAPRVTPARGGVLAAVEWPHSLDLAAALEGLVAEPLELEPLRVGPEPWRAGARRWLLDELEALTVRALRAREEPHLPNSGVGARERTLALLARSAGLFPSAGDPAASATGPEPGGGPLESAAALRLEQIRCALDAGAPPPRAGAEGSLAAAALRAAARRARVAGAPAEALALLERIAPAAPDPWGRARAGALATELVQGEALLDLGRAQESLIVARRHSELHPGLCELLARAAEACGDAPAASAARVRLGLLRGERRLEGDRLATGVRGRHRGGVVPPALLEPVFAIDPLSPLGHFTLARARFLRGGGGLDEMLLHGERWPLFLSTFHRHVFGMWIGDLSFGHLKRDLLGEGLAALSPLQTALVGAIFLEIRGGGSSAAQAQLDALDAAWGEAPGALGPRLARAFLYLRAGYRQAAARELAWLEAEVPGQGLARYYRALHVGAGEASPAACVEALRRASRAGFQTWREQAWDPRAYPELAPYLGTRALESFLRQEIGWTGARGF